MKWPSLLVVPTARGAEKTHLYESLRMSPCRVRLTVPGRLAAALKFCRRKAGLDAPRELQATRGGTQKPHSDKPGTTSQGVG